MVGTTPSYKHVITYYTWNKSFYKKNPQHIKFFKIYYVIVKKSLVFSSDLHHTGNIKKVNKHGLLSTYAIYCH